MSYVDMNEYDRKAWADIEAWRSRSLSSQHRRLLPAPARQGLAKAGSVAHGRFERLPGAESFSKLLFKALEGLVGTVNRLSMASVRKAAVVEAFAKAGHAVAELADIASLPLREIDKAKPRLDLHYILASTLEGAGAGLAVSGGEIVGTGGSVFSAGAAAAPSAVAIVGIMAADAAAVLVASARSIAHTAAYYGYDTDIPEERIFALGVLNFGLAEQAGKIAAYIELNKIVQALARRALWQQLDKNAVAQVVKTVYATLGMKVTKDKLGQVVPVVGVLIGAGLNARTLQRVTSGAEHLYRERFIRERYGLLVASDDGGAIATDGDDATVSIVDIVDAALEEESGGEADSNGST